MCAMWWATPWAEGSGEVYRKSVPRRAREGGRCRPAGGAIRGFCSGLRLVALWGSPPRISPERRSWTSDSVGGVSPPLHLQEERHLSPPAIPPPVLWRPRPKHQCRVLPCHTATMRRQERDRRPQLRWCLSGDGRPQRSVPGEDSPVDDRVRMRQGDERHQARDQLLHGERERRRPVLEPPRHGEGGGCRPPAKTPPVTSRALRGCWVSPLQRSPHTAFARPVPPG